VFLHFLQLHFRGHFCVHFLHSSVEAQRSLQCYSYIFAAIFVYIFVHPCLPSSVDAQRRLYSTPTLICGCTAVSTVIQLHFRGQFRVHFRTSTPTFICGCTATSLFYNYTHLWMYSFVHPRLHSSRPITCLVFKVAKSAWLHFTHQTEISLFTTFDPGAYIHPTFYIYI